MMREGRNPKAEIRRKAECRIGQRGLKRLRACLKNRPVGAPGLQDEGFSPKSCRPRAPTRPPGAFFKQTLRACLRMDEKRAQDRVGRSDTPAVGGFSLSRVAGAGGVR